MKVLYCKFFVLMLTWSITVSTQAEVKPEHFIIFEKGDLPIILSAPHGGGEAIPNVEARLGKNVARFVDRTDYNTKLLTEKLAYALEKKLGKRPYVVIAKFHRKYVDANRKPTLAYESSNARLVYDAYHSAITKARRDVIERWGRGILLDIHGQNAEPKAIIRGTQNGKTVAHLVNRFGKESLIGDASLFGRLAKQGFPVIPKVNSTAREHEAYDGGYIVIQYGSGAGDTVDAIQVEVGRELRSAKQIEPTADKIALGIASFANSYLPKVEATKSR